MKKKLLYFTVMIILTAIILTACTTEPFRLHVIANSDSKVDQEVKLKVRDAILELVNEDMDNISTKEEAEEYIASNLQIIKEKADEVLNENGMDYTAMPVIGTFEFPEKTYGDVVYPAGEYDALRIVLGKGEGQNWWCVLFPPLCLMEIDPESTDDLSVQNGEEDIQFVSFFEEIFKELFGLS
ncbi:MAG: stage II sporulation protein R [Eubacteriales bacterium]